MTSSSASPGPPSDDELVRRAATIDPASLAILYDRHAAPCFALARRMLGEGPPSNDAVRQAFLHLWRVGASFDRSLGTVRGQLLDLVHELCVQTLRTAGGAAVPPRSPEHGEGLRGLSDELWAVLELAYFQGLTERQIAERLDLPIEAVKRRTRVGLEQLRDRLPDGGGSAV